MGLSRDLSDPAWRARLGCLDWVEGPAVAFLHGLRGQPRSIAKLQGTLKANVRDGKAREAFERLFDHHLTRHPAHKLAHGLWESRMMAVGSGLIAAVVRWPEPDRPGVLSSPALRWLFHRVGPPLHAIARPPENGAVLTLTSPAESVPGPGGVRLLVPTGPPPAFAPGLRADGTAMPLGDVLARCVFFGDALDPASPAAQALAAGDFLGAASCWPRMRDVSWSVRAALSLMAGDVASARAEAPPDDAAGDSIKVHASLLRMVRGMALLVEGDARGALATFLTPSNPWPMWALLQAAALEALGQPAWAARAVLTPSAVLTGFTAWPAIEALRLLAAAGVAAPSRLERAAAGGVLSLRSQPGLRDQVAAAVGLPSDDARFARQVIRAFGVRPVDDAALVQAAARSVPREPRPASPTGAPPGPGPAPPAAAPAPPTPVANVSPCPNVEIEMPPAVDPDSLRERLDRPVSSRDALIERLKALVEDLHAGRCPAGDARDALAAFGVEFEAVRSALAAEADTTLDGLQVALEERTARSRHRRVARGLESELQQARRLVVDDDRVHREVSERLAELEALLRDAADLDALSALDGLMDPVRALLGSIPPPAELDEVCALEDRIEEQFSRRVSRAASRGLFSLADPPEPDTAGAVDVPDAEADAAAAGVVGFEVAPGAAEAAAVAEADAVADVEVEVEDVEDVEDEDEDVEDEDEAEDVEDEDVEDEDVEDEDVEDEDEDVEDVEDEDVEAEDVEAEDEVVEQAAAGSEDTDDADVADGGAGVDPAVRALGDAGDEALEPGGDDLPVPVHDEADVRDAVPGEASLDGAARPADPGADLADPPARAHVPAPAPRARPAQGLDEPTDDPITLTVADRVGDDGDLLLLPDDRFGAFDAWPWLEGALDPDRRGLLSRAWMAASLAGANATVPAPLIGALLLSRYAVKNEGPLVDRLYEFYVEAAGASGDLDDALLRFAASARASLMCPYAEPASFLEEVVLPDDFPHIAALRDAVREAARQGVPVNPFSHRGVRKRVQIENALKELTLQICDWRDRQLQAMLMFERATVLLKQYLRDKDKLGAAIDAIEEDSPDALRLATEACELFPTDEAFRRHIRKSEKELGGAAAGKPTVGRALRALVSRLTEVRDLLDQWRGVKEEWEELQAGVDLQALGERAAALHDAVASELPAAREELQRLIGETPEPSVRIAGRWLARELAWVDEILAGKLTALRSVPPRHLLWGGLLYVRGLALDEWRPRTWPTSDRADSTMDRLHAMLVDSRDIDTLDEALDAHNQMGAIASARRVLDHEALVYGIAEEALETATARIDETLHDQREALLAKVRVQRDQVETHTGFLLSERDRAALLEIVEQVHKEAKEGGEDLGFLREVLDEVDRRIDGQLFDQRERLLADLKARTEGVAGERPIHPDVVEMVHRLAKDNLQMARAVLDLAARVEPEEILLHRTGDIDPDPFYPNFLAEYEAKVASGRLDEHRIKAFLRNDNSPEYWPFQPGWMKPEARRSSLSMIDAWYELVVQGRRTDRPNFPEVRRKAVQRLFTALGFGVTEPPELRDRPYVSEFDLQVEPSDSRVSCLLPRYGSASRGRYKALVFWRAVPIPEMLAEASAYRDRPVIIIPAQTVLVRADRRDLWEESLEQRQSVLVLDEAAVLYLASRCLTSRRPFFDTLTPFSYAEPYVVGASYVEPEMFFGRREEREAILRPSGACLVYGGRQLGKTSLLRDIVRTNHRPDRGQLVYYIDLRDGGPRQSDPENVWTMIAERLQQPEAGVLPDARVRRRDRQRDSILAWLADEAHPTRSILLLIDEADAFLERDAEPKEAGRDDTRYLMVRFLKSIMEETRSAFKVVFAGLHDVQRSSNDPNSPLAQLRQPLCIGPLIDKGEWLQARDMVVEPFRALGFRFEHPQLVLHLLQRANFYPSLIQLYCKQLLDKMTRGGFALNRSADALPVTITSIDVDAVWRDRELREAFRERFVWTLDLDVRYKLIAYVVVFETLSQGDKPEAAIAFRAADIRDLVLSWGRGFRGDESLARFRILLNELAGLGVLRRVGDDRYALRSSALVQLFGQKMDVEQRIFEIAEREPEPVRDPGRYRTLLGATQHDRSPLTAEQEHELLGGSTDVGRPGDPLPYEGVMAVVGTCLASIADVPQAIARVCAPTDGPARFPLVCSVLPDRIGTAAAFETWLSGARGSSDSGGDIVVVPATVAWTKEWLEVARASVKRRRTLPLKVVFVGDDLAAWGIARAGAAAPACVALEPWDRGWQRDWLMEGGAVAPEVLDDMYTQFGGWGGPLRQLLAAGAPAPQAIQAAKARLTADEILRQPQLRAFSQWLAMEVGTGAFSRLDLAEYYELFFLDTLTPDAADRSRAVFPPDDPEPFLTWLDLLGLTEHVATDDVGDPRWRLTAFAVMVLQAGRPVD